MAYDNPIYQTIVAPANASLSTAADVFMGQGPAGKVGRFEHICMVMTTANSAAAAGLDLGTQADDDLYGTISTAAVQADNSAVVATEAELTALGELPADTVFLISGDGAGTAGVADITVVIAWY